MSPKQLIQAITYSILNKTSLLITGPPGAGKSDGVEQGVVKASEMLETEVDLHISHPVVADPTDYKGLPTLSNGEAMFVPFNDLKLLMEADKPTVYFLDDLGQASSSVQAAAMQLLLARRINGHKVSDHVTFIAATNRREDKAGVTGILEPVKSRFTIVELAPTVEDWVEWALGRDDVPLELIGAVRWKPEWIENWKPSKGIVNTPCPRNLHEVGKMMKWDMPESIAFEMYAGRLGTGDATELMAYLKLFRNLPTAKQIAQDPDNAPIPHEPSALYGLVGSLVGNASKDNMGAFLTYVDRLPKEYAILFGRDIARNPKTKSLQHGSKYVEWVSRNTEYILMSK